LSRAAPRVWRRPNPLPGFGLALGFTVAYLSAVVLIPLSALVIRAARLGLSDLFTLVTDGRVLAALRVSFGVAFAASIIDVIFGALIAWTLTRYRFPGRRIFDAAIDLPFALPTAVAGIALATLYAPNGVFGAPLAKLGLRVAHPLGHSGRVDVRRSAVRRAHRAADP
jgi:sulfate/thiosulfate transport system permease protein